MDNRICAVLLSEFDIDIGATYCGCYPPPDQQKAFDVSEPSREFFANHMLPDGAEKVEVCSTVFMLNRSRLHHRVFRFPIYTFEKGTDDEWALCRGLRTRQPQMLSFDESSQCGSISFHGDIIKGPCALSSIQFNFLDAVPSLVNSFIAALQDDRAGAASVGVEEDLNDEYVFLLAEGFDVGFVTRSSDLQQLLRCHETLMASMESSNNSHSLTGETQDGTDIFLPGCVSSSIRSPLFGVTAVVSWRDSAARRGGITKAVAAVGTSLGWLQHMLPILVACGKRCCEVSSPGDVEAVLKTCYDVLHNMAVSSQPNYSLGSEVTVYCTAALPSALRQRRTVEIFGKSCEIDVPNLMEDVVLPDYGIDRLLLSLQLQFMKLVMGVLTGKNIVVISRQKTSYDVCQVVIALGVIGSSLSPQFFESSVFPYVSVNDTEFTTATQYVVGTMNPIFENAKVWKWDLLYDLDNNVVRAKGEEERQAGSSVANTASSVTTTLATAVGIAETGADTSDLPPYARVVYTQLLSNIQRMQILHISPVERCVRARLLLEEYCHSLVSVALAEELPFHLPESLWSAFSTPAARSFVSAVQRAGFTSSFKATVMRVEESLELLVLGAALRRSKLKSEAEVLPVVTRLLELVATEDAVLCFLRRMTIATGGLAPLAVHIMSSNFNIRLSTWKLLQRIEASPLGRQCFTSLPHFLYYAYEGFTRKQKSLIALRFRTIPASVKSFMQKVKEMQPVAFYHENPEALRELVRDLFSLLLPSPSLLPPQTPSSEPTQHSIQNGDWPVLLNLPEYQECFAKVRDLLHSALTSLPSSEDGSHHDCNSLVELVSSGKHVACGKNYVDGEFVVKCYECSLDPSSIMCFKCFMTSPCRQHNFMYLVSRGSGMCDCGDPFSWKEDSFCKDHTSSDKDCLDHCTPKQLAFATVVVDCYCQAIAFYLLAAVVTLPVKHAAMEFPVDLEQCVKDLLQICQEGGDGGKKLVTAALQKPLEGCAGQPILPRELCERYRIVPVVSSPLDALFLVYALCGKGFDTNTLDDEDDNEAPEASVELADKWKYIPYALRECMCNHDFRILYGMVSMRYMLHPAQREIFENLQALANISVVEYLMDPAHMPISGYTWGSHTVVPSHDTLIHRFLSGLFYISSHPLSTSSEGPVAVSIEGFDRFPYLLLNISSSVVTSALSHYTNQFDATMCCTSTSGLCVCTSRTAFRAFVLLMDFLAVSTTIIGTVEGSQNSGHMVKDVIAGYMSLQTSVQFAVREYNRLCHLLIKDNPEEIDAFVTTHAKLFEDISKSRKLDDMSCPGDRTVAHRWLCDAVQLRDEESSLIGITAAGDGNRFACESFETYSMDIMTEIWKAARHMFAVVAQATPSHHVVLESVCEKDVSSVLDYVINPRHVSPRPIILCTFIERFLAEMLQATIKYNKDSVDSSSLSYCQLWRVAFQSDDGQRIVMKRRPLLTPPHTPLGVPFLSLIREDDLAAMLDFLTLRFVWAGQTDDGMWRSRTDGFDVSGVFLSATHFTFLLQALASIYAPLDFTYRVMERFLCSILEDNRKGLTHFLWLIASLIASPPFVSGEMNGGEAYTYRTTKMHIVAMLVHGPRSRKSVESYVQRCIIGSYHWHDDPSGGNAIHKVLGEVAVESGEASPVWRLKGTAECQAINLYHHSFRGLDLEHMIQGYASVASFEARMREKEMEDTASSSSPPNSPPTAPKVHLPVLELPSEDEDLTSPLWWSRTRDLLHTPAVICGCSFVLRSHLDHLNLKQQRNSQPEHTYAPRNVLTAVQLLFWCCSDALRISKSMKYMKDPESIASPDYETVDWSLVAEYLGSHVFHKESFTVASTNPLLPVSFLGDEGQPIANFTLKEAMTRPMRMDGWASLFEDNDGGRPVGEAVSLQQIFSQLHQYYCKNSSDDHFGLADMLSHVLLSTDTFVSHSAECVQSALNDNLSRREKMKQKQKEIMKRFRKRKQTVADGEGEEDQAAVVVPSSPSWTAPADIGFHQILCGKIGLANCEICRNVRGGPLLLFAQHTPTDTLLKLGYQEATAPSYHTCGHAVHAECWEMYQIVNQRVRSTCPLCHAPSSALLPLPVQVAGKMAESEDEEDDEARIEHDEAKEEDRLHQWDEVALCKMDVPASDAWKLLAPDSNPTGNSPLAHSKAEQWLMVLQAQLSVQMELIKIGDAITINDLSALVSLIVSVSQVLKEGWQNQEDLRRQLKQPFLILLLDVLTDDTTAATPDLIAAFTQRMVGKESVAKAMVSDLLLKPTPLSLTSELVALWGSLGCLTLLKLVLLTGDHNSRLVDIKWLQTSAKLSIQDRIGLADIHFPTLQPAVLTSPNGMATAVVDMIGFLLLPKTVEVCASHATVVDELKRLFLGWEALPSPPTLSEEEEGTLCAVALLVPAVNPMEGFHASPSFSPLEWQQRVVQHILHLPKDYIDIVCDMYNDIQPTPPHWKPPPARCLGCLRWVLNIDRRLVSASQTLMVNHMQSCSECEGIGIFLSPHYNCLFIIDTVSSKFMIASTPYVSESGISSGMVRGNYHMSDALMSSLVRRWIKNCWSST